MKDTRPNIKLSNWETHQKLKEYAVKEKLTISKAIDKLLDERYHNGNDAIDAVKIIALEGGGDWADASVDYMVNVSGRSGEELNYEYIKNGRYHGTGKRWFKQWAIDMGYCREASDDELEVVHDL